jgi:hypothetical protein
VTSIGLEIQFGRRGTRNAPLPCSAMAVYRGGARAVQQGGKAKASIFRAAGGEQRAGGAVSLSTARDVSSACPAMVCIRQACGQGKAPVKGLERNDRRAWTVGGFKHRERPYALCTKPQKVPICFLGAATKSGGGKGGSESKTLFSFLSAKPKEKVSADQDLAEVK